MNRLLLIDANPFIFKSYYGGGDDPGLRSDGLPTGAVGGFLSRIWDLTRKELSGQRFTHTVAVFDAPGQNWRHNLSDAYKANREEQPSELKLQLRLARHLMPMMGFHAVQQRGYEADDLIATYARVNDEDGGETVIVSADKDLYCLVKQGTAIYVPASAHKPARWITTAEVVEKFGVLPHQVPDLQGLCGDSTDNIAGVPGVGAKTAAKLILQFGSLEMALKQADIADVGPKLRQSLQLFAEEARLSRQLVALNSEVPLIYPIEDLFAFPVNAPALLSALRALEIEAFAKWVAWSFDLRADEAVPCQETLEMAAEMQEAREIA